MQFHTRSLVLIFFCNRAILLDVVFDVLFAYVISITRTNILKFLSVSVFVAETRDKEGSMRANESSKIREVWRHGQFDLLEWSQCTPQLEAEILR